MAFRLGFDAKELIGVERAGDRMVLVFCVPVAGDDFELRIVLSANAERELRAGFRAFAG